MKKEFDIKHNCFDILRYLAAFAVMMLHYTYYAFMEAEQAWLFMDRLRKTSQIFSGVAVFIGISGFLISDSMERAKSKKEFLIKRVFRLYPELWLCTIVNVVFLLIVAGEHLDSSIIIWIFTQIIGFANTPSCLANFATGSINGALWTILVEVQLYIILCFAYKKLKKMKFYAWCILLCGTIAVNLICGYLTASNLGSIFSKLLERSFLPYAIWFFIGAFCYCYKEKVINILKWTMLPLLICYLYFHMDGVVQPGYYIEINASILTPFIIIGLAYILPAFRIKCDLSYGMFLYHWIVLNLIVHHGWMQTWPWQVCLVFFIVVTLVMAWISRMVTEKILFKVRKSREL